MENKVLEENIEQIKHYDNELANKILMFDLEKSNLELAQNENGEYNIIFNSIPLHSTIGAIQEAKQIAQNIKDEKNSIKIIYGLGLGYLPDEISNKIKEGYVINYEPNLEILKFVLSIAKIDTLFKKNVFLCSNKNELEKLVSNLANEETQLSVSFLNTYKNLYFEDIKNTLYHAQKTQGEIIGNKNTFLKKAPSCFVQTMYNLKNIFNNPNISDIKDVYKDKTAIILCAGPSLKDNIELISKNQDKFVIFALNPTLVLLQKYSIKPDFIVYIENINSTKQFPENFCQDSYFIKEAFSNYWVSHYREFKKTFNYISNDNFFNYWVRDCLKLNDSLKSYGTVSYSAFMSAYIMGFKKIIIVGQDLAFKDNLCYPRECQYGEMECIWDEEEKKYKIIARDIKKLSLAYRNSKTTEEQELRYAKEYLNSLNKNITTVISQDGKYIPSKTDYTIFIKLFEEIAKELKNQNPNIELINCSKGGAQINGFENMDLEDIIQNLEKVEKLNLDNYSVNIDKRHILSKVEKLYDQLDNYQKIIEDFISKNEKIIKELENKKEYTKNAQNLLQKHTKLLSDMINLSKTKDIDFIVKVYLKKYEKYFKFNYLKDINMTIKTLKEMNADYNKIIPFLVASKKGLCDCKTLVLE